MGRPKPAKEQPEARRSAADCYAVDSPEGELRHMLEVAHANGFRSITDAITMARKYRDALRRLQDAVIARMIPDDPTGAERLELLRASDEAREILGHNDALSGGDLERHSANSNENEA